jgi:hypothetical protein
MFVAEIDIKWKRAKMFGYFKNRLIKIELTTQCSENHNHEMKDKSKWKLLEMTASCKPNVRELY